MRARACAWLAGWSCLALAAGCAPTGGGDPADPSGTGTGQGGGDDATSAMEANFASQAGDFALDYLRGDIYRRIHVEVDHVAGRAPDARALDRLADTLSALGHKPDGVEVVVDDVIPDQGAPAWTVPDAQALEEAHRDRYHDPASGTAVLYVLYLDGRSDRDDDEGNVLAYAYRGSSVHLFADTVSELGGGLLGLRADPEGIVLQHEAGHILGLVDNGIAMVEDHRDREHGNHDVDEDCLMSWAIETPDVADVLLRRVPTFDDACLDDVEAAGGRTAADARASLP